MSIKIKVRCECRQKIRVPIRKIGASVPCPGCKKDVTIPRPGDPSVVELQCRCGHLVEPGQAFCLGCGLAILESIEARLAAGPGDHPEDDETDDLPATAKRPRPAEFAGPIEIPDGFELHEKTLVKFLCRCGQKVRIKYRQRDRGEPCPKCKEALTVPDVTRERSVSVICPTCEKPLETGRRRCAGCDWEIVVEMARTVFVAVPSIKDPLPEAPLSPTMIAPAVTAPPPPAAPASDDTQVALPAVSAAPASPSRRRRPAARGSRGPLLVFVFGLAVSGAMAVWLFSGGSPHPAPEEPSPTTRPTEPAGGGLGLGGGSPFGGTLADPPPGGPDPARSVDPVRPPDPPDRRDPPPPDPRPDPPGDPARDPPGPSRVEDPFDAAYAVLVADDAPPAPAGVSGDQASGGGVAAGAPDAEFYTKKIEPLMVGLQCFQCHGNAALPTGKFKMKAPGRFGINAATSRQNFESVLSFVNSSNPSRSPFLTKPLAIADGGAEHGGGDRFKKSDPAYGVWNSFVRGEAAGSSKPSAAIALAASFFAVGAAAKLDGSGSVDPVGQSLKYRWELVLGPRGSGARVLESTQAVATLRPDLPGAYLLQLVVTDGAGVASEPARVVLRARGPAPREHQTPKPDELDRALKLGLVQRLTAELAGHEPDPLEIESALALTPEGLARLLVAESDFWSAWYSRDLAHLHLVEDFRPAGDDFDRLPVRIANGQVSAAQALDAVLASPAFQARYPTPEGAATALHQRLAGRRSADGAGDPSLPARLVAEPPFAELYLRRHHEAIFGSAPGKDHLARWASALRRNPADLPSIVLEWVTDPNYLAD